MSWPIGETAALGAALAWAIGSLIFSRVRVPAAALNLSKNSLSCGLLLATLIVLPSGAGRPVFQSGAGNWGWLALSAVSGLVIGDTCYFRSLQILGPRRAVVLITLTPPLAAVAGWLLLGESPTPSILAGMVVTLAGVTWVLHERGAAAESAGHYPGTTLSGFLYGLSSSVCQALGAVFSKVGMQGITSLEATFIRLLVASLLGLSVALAGRRLIRWFRDLLAPGVVARVVPASICGTYFGIWLSLISYRNSPVSVATTLTSTTPIFVLPLVWFFLRQRVSLRAVLGASVAVAGVVLLFAA